MNGPLTPDVRVTRYTVSCIPESNIDRPHFDVTVEYRGVGRWSIMHRGCFCLGRDGEWEYESIPSERREEWLTEHRFTESEALGLAREWAPKIRCNGKTVTDVLAWEASM